MSSQAKREKRAQSKAKTATATAETKRALAPGEDATSEPGADDADDEGVVESGDAASPRRETPDRGTAPTARSRTAPKSIWVRATYRWVAVTSVMMALYVLYMQHPYYKNQQFTPFKTIYTPAFIAWIGLGVFYIKATMQKFSGMRYTMRDAPLHLVMLWKAWQNKRFWRIAKNRRVRTTLLAIVVKGFFTPLMTGFVVGHLNSISRAWLAHKHLAPLEFKPPAGTGTIATMQLWWHQVASRLVDFVPTAHDLAAAVQPWTWSRPELSWGLQFAYDIIFAVDCGFALFGYASESRWLDNKTRSVEPTAFGWAVCIFCYPPFNNVLGTYLPLNDGGHFITNEDALLALRGGTVFLFAIYAAATVAFGVRFSNLTNRGIISRGPYRFVRHPAYLCKCSAWWLEHLPTISLPKAFFLTCLCGVYALRAWTEERHLGADPDYRAYKKKTPWVLFPGVY